MMAAWLDMAIQAVTHWLQQWSTWQVALGAAALVLLLVLLWAWLAKPQPAGIAEVAAAGGARGLCNGLWRRVEAVLQALDYLSTRREWRYRQPWMLLLGEQGSGKTSLLHSVSAELRQRPPAHAAALHAEHTAWSYFRLGVLVDPAGKYPAAAAGSADAQRWLHTLDEIKALRPERPLDGLVLCVSARSLLQAGHEARTQLATELYQQLTVLQEQLEFMLPLTVVVTQCDAIDGFDAFWRAQDAARRGELFGYSAPSQAQTDAPAQWADSAFDYLGERLRELQIDAAAQRDDIAEPDAFFLFPSHFRALQAPLRLLLSSVFRTSAWQAGYLFRGLFFTGSPGAGGAPQEGARADVAFVDALLTTRVLAEGGLARPTRDGVFSRNRVIRKVQYGALALGLGLFVALYFNGQRAARQVEVLASAQAELKRTTPEAQRKGECLGAESIYPLLGQVARIDNDTAYWAIPASWLDSRMSQRSDESIETGAVGRVLLPTLACRLEQRARELLARPVKLPRATDNDAFSASRSMLNDYLAEVSTLEQNLARFDSLARHGGELERAALLDTLAKVAEYAFGAPLPHAVLQERGALSAGFSDLPQRERLDLPPRMRPDFARQIRRIAAQVRSNLHEEIKRGVDLLARLDRAEAPVLTNTRRFAQWLNWTQQSWLLSTPSSNPCEEIRLGARASFQSLVQQYGYDSALMRELERFDAERCYRPELAVLAELRLAPYGALFAPRKPLGLELAAGLRRELDGMADLVQLSFMRLPSTQSFVCQPGGEGFRQAELAEAVSYLKEYEAYADRLKLKGRRADSRPLYDRLARLSLGSALDDVMHRAQIAPREPAYQQVSLQSVLQGDPQLSAMSQELAGGLDKLLTVLERYGEYGDARSIPVLRQCARDFAADSLSRISALADASRLYAPTPAVAGEQLYDLGSLPVLKEFLARQVARAQVLANYATPFMNLLAGSQGVADTRRPAEASAEFWRNSIDELNRYTQGKDPAGQVANLENYFIKPLGELSYANCGKQLAGYQSPAFGNDLFSQRRRPLENQVQQRCSNREAAQAMEVYEALARRFNRELAGRYPFADGGATDAPAALVRQFFLDYAQQRPTLEQAMAVLGGERWRPARQFVAELDAAAEFFRGNLLAGEADTGLPIRLRLVFNAPNRPASGSEQIVAWLLGSGTQAAGLPNRGNTLDWQIGQGLALDLTWAGQSIWTPVSDLRQDDLVVEGDTATFVASQTWALLRLIERHAVLDATAAARGQLLLGFSVPQQHALDPGKAERKRVQLYLAMSLVSVDPKTQTEQRLRLPAQFPRAAPGG